MAVVFLLHQGYSFLFFVADGTDDPPVLGQRQIRQGSWLDQPTWLDLTFRFTPDGGFHDVPAGRNLTDLFRRK
jgi:hypothetical protein